MKTVVITGSTRGLGLGLAKRFLEKGCNVVLNGTRQESLDRAMNNLREFSDRVAGVVADTSSEANVERLYREAERRFSCVDIWINNAGLGQPPVKVWMLESGLPERIASVNIMGVVHGTIVPFRRMSARGSGMIFNMEGHGSDGGIIDGMSLYGMTKSAASYFTKAFAHEARGSGVVIGRLQPGMVVTDLLMETLDGNDPESAKRRKIYNLLADHVDTVSAFLVDGVLSATGSAPRIVWLTRSKVLFRLLTGTFRKRDVFRKEAAC